MKLTKSAVDRILLTAAGQTYHYDSELAGFGLRVGRKRKTYFAESRVHGKTVRVTIGPHGAFTPEQARTVAKEQLRFMAGGVDPNDVKAAARARSVTLGEVFEAFLDARKGLKPRTVSDYRRFMGMPDPDARPSRVPRNDPRPKPIYLCDWKDKPLTEITRDMVERRHALLGQTSEAQANLAMRFLRALFNFAAGRRSGPALLPAERASVLRRSLLICSSRRSVPKRTARPRSLRRSMYLIPGEFCRRVSLLGGLGAPLTE